MPRQYQARAGAGGGQLDDLERAVVEELTAPLMLDELAARTGLGEVELAEVIAALEERGLVADVADGPPGVLSLDAPIELEESLPPGVQPWSGESMAEGVASVPPERDAPEDENDSDTPGEYELDARDEATRSPLSDEPPPSSEVPSSGSVQDGNYRQIYEAELRSLDVDARIAKAKTAHGERLVAFCYDPDPKVISALLENATFGLQHARMIALHHRNARGLEILARRVELLADPQVQQRLLKNPQLPDGVLAKLIATKPLRTVYKRSVDRNIPERTRSRVRSQLRANFNRAEPTERADLLIRTDGRALLLLTGCTLDGRTTQILCGKSTFTTLFVQSFARFGATPPQLLVRMIKTPTVQRQPQLKTLLLRHPNMPSDVKRRF